MTLLRLKVGTIFGEVTEIIEREDMVRPSEIVKEPKNSDIKLEDVTECDTIK